tara:strand:- start:4599 stop:5147 length:549 start_codon:yes stop_codon:yes gene_type:complete
MKKVSFKEKKNLIINIKKNIFLKILSKKDVSKNYVNWMNDKEITKFTEQRNFNHKKKDIENFIHLKLRSVDEFLFGIFYLNKHVGNIKLGPINQKEKSAEVSFLIGEKSLWGKGITTVSLLTIIKFGISLGLQKICAGYYEMNTGSEKVFKKCGFKVTRILKHENNPQIYSKSIMVEYLTDL